MLSEGREVVLRTKGNSMDPFIRGGEDSVMLFNRGQESIQTGDIVLAHVTSDRYVLHRVIDIEGNVLTLMGDGNLIGTEVCTRADVLGTAIKIIKPSGREIVPGKAVLWRKLKPARRYILAIYRRII